MCPVNYTLRWCCWNNCSDDRHGDQQVFELDKSTLDKVHDDRVVKSGQYHFQVSHTTLSLSPNSNFARRSFEHPERDPSRVGVKVSRLSELYMSS